MDQHNNPSPSFINIAVLLLFALVIAVASSVTTYFILNSRSDEQYSAAQSSVVPPPQTYVQLTSTPVGTTNQTVPDETTDWKVYTNTKVGFMIKYPKRYSEPKLPTGPIGPDIYATGLEDDEYIIFDNPSLDSDSFGLNVFPFKGTLNELVNYNGMRSRDFLDVKTFVKNIKVGTINALYFITTAPTVYPENKNDSGSKKIYFLGRNHGFILEPSRNYQEKEIEQILSTFKFLE